jgi:hypothetical protein
MSIGLWWSTNVPLLLLSTVLKIEVSVDEVSWSVLHLGVESPSVDTGSSNQQRRPHASSHFAHAAIE